MATQTTNYKLHKFDLADTPADITVLNPSMDIIDTQLKSLSDKKFDKSGGTISGNVAVTGTSTFTGKLTANGGIATKALVATGLDLNGNGDISGTLVVGGAATFNAAVTCKAGLTTTTLKATGNSTLAALSATNITASGTVSVTGASTFTGLLTANGSITTKKVTATELDLNGNGDVSGTFVVGGKLTANGGLETKSFTAQSLNITGNASVGGLLAVTGVASLNGGGSVKTPTANVNDTSIINAAWARNLIQSYGLGAGIGTAPSYTGTLGDLDATGFYTLSGTYSDAPSGYSTITGQILHVQRRFEAGTQGFQLLPIGNRLMYRTNGSGTWLDWVTVATQDYVQTQVNSLTTLTDDGLQTTGGIDYNTVVNPGFYAIQGSGSTNGPVTNAAYRVVVLSSKGSNYVTQLAVPIFDTKEISRNSQSIAFRNRNSAGDTWSDWRKLLLVESSEAVKAGSLELESNGIIHYPGNSSSSVPNWGFSVSNFSKGDTPAREITARTYLYDQNNSGQAVGAIAGTLYGITTSGRTYARLCAFRNASGASTMGSIDVFFDPDGTVFTQVPATADNATGRQIATAAFALDHGGRAWGLGTNAPSYAQEGIGFASINEINKCGFYSVSGTDSGAASNTSTLLHVQRQWNAGNVGFQLNFGRSATVHVRSLDDSTDTTQWGAWKQLADRDWVMENLSSAIPAGAICYFAQKAVPDGWLFCNGSNVSRTTYSKLFAAIGTTNGAGDGSTTFKLPNLRTLFIQGANSTSEVGATVAAGLPNITGGVGAMLFGSTNHNRAAPAYGAFYKAEGDYVSMMSGEENLSGIGNSVMDASRVSSVYGASTTVQPPAVKLLPCIKY